MQNPECTIRPTPSAEYELKFVFSNATAPMIVRWLECRCRPDPDFPAGIVSSIYYDSPDRALLEEKINSDYLKTKVRLRWYADMETGEPGEESFLEVKHKTGSRRHKFRMPGGLSGRRLDRLPLESPELLGIRHVLRASGIRPERPLFPACRITYRRRRFVEPVTGARLSVDWDIRMPQANPLIVRSGPVRLERAVVEVKGAADELPDVLHPLTALGGRREAFSKYMCCCLRQP